jgi:hypothetical protein
MTHRIETRPGWRPIVARLLLANSEARTRCQAVIEERARNELVRRGYDVLELLMESPDAAARLQELSEAADEQYLSALDANDGIASEAVMNQFAIARGLASLAFTKRGNGAAEVLDAAYELAVIASEEEEGLSKDISAVLAA